MFVRAHGMQRNVVGLMTAVDIGGYLAVTVASDILQGSTAGGLLLQTVYGHYGEQLVQSP